MNGLHKHVDALNEELCTEKAAHTADCEMLQNEVPKGNETMLVVGLK